MSADPRICCRSAVRHAIPVALLAMISTVSSAAYAQQPFKTAEAAVDALAAAARVDSRKNILTILGPGSSELVSSGDTVQDEEARKGFIAAYDAAHSIKRDEGKPTAILLIGKDDFPFPIPLIEKNGSWSFDAKAGREEILARRIGRNELAAIQVALAFYDAENDYANITPKADGMAVYARRIVSRPGTKDGLFWPSAQGEPPSPIGEAVAEASQRGYRVGVSQPYHGYRYKVLTRQGPNARGGALTYVVNGKMIGGFALIAWPAEYGNSGIATFMINHRGEVYEKDLGPRTSRVVSRTTSFNPDHTWRVVAKTDLENLK